MTIDIEKMSEEFTKFHFKSLPFDAVMHRFAAPDVGSPHCHPFNFTSHILYGGYIERVYTVYDDDRWTSEIIHREAGTVHRVKAKHIHEIIQLPQGECYTIILPEEKTRDSRFWNFDESFAKSRAWFEGDFK